MYGLEEDNNKNFLFELEKQLKKDSRKKQELLKKAEERVAEIKQLLRSGQQEEHFDRLGVLLNGYSALQKTLNRITT